MNRAELLCEVHKRLGRRKLVWAGIRGDDIDSIADLDQLSASYSIIGAYRKRSSIEGVALEDMTARRVDMELWDIDDYRHEAPAVEFRRSLLRALGSSSALLTYRPSQFLSAIWFARRDRCLNLGLFGAHQFAFEHKPWVETAVEGLGIPHIPWTYVADEEQLQTTDLLERGSVLLRQSRTSGGQGFYHVHSAEELKRLWPESDEAFVSVAPYFGSSIPINVGATVWENGVSVHYPSVQLIGIPQCVTRQFGYCGNDFFAARSLERKTVDDIETYTTTIGYWLKSKGYLGTFGVDYLLDDQGVLRFTEVNARFQGSTAASGRISAEANQPCLLLEHIAAYLGMLKPTTPPLAERMAEISPVSQIVVHWTGERATNLDAQSLRDFVHDQKGYSDVAIRPDLAIEPGGTVIRMTVPQSVTLTGFELVEPFAAAIKKWQREIRQHEEALET